MAGKNITANAFPGHDENQIKKEATFMNNTTLANFSRTNKKHHKATKKILEKRATLENRMKHFFRKHVDPYDWYRVHPRFHGLRHEDGRMTNTTKFNNLWRIPKDSLLVESSPDDFWRIPKESFKQSALDDFYRQRQDVDFPNKWWFQKENFVLGEKIPERDIRQHNFVSTTPNNPTTERIGGTSDVLGNVCVTQGGRRKRKVRRTRRKKKKKKKTRRRKKTRRK
jgi:hypothetical protein